MMNDKSQDSRRQRCECFRMLSKMCKMPVRIVCFVHFLFDLIFFFASSLGDSSSTLLPLEHVYESKMEKENFELTSSHWWNTSPSINLGTWLGPHFYFRKVIINRLHQIQLSAFFAKWKVRISFSQSFSSFSLFSKLALCLQSCSFDAFLLLCSVLRLSMKTKWATLCEFFAT